MCLMRLKNIHIIIFYQTHFECIKYFNDYQIKKNNKICKLEEKYFININLKNIIFIIRTLKILKIDN